MGLQPIDIPQCVERTVGDAPRRLSGVDQRFPGHRRSKRWDVEIEIFVIGVHHYEKTLVDVSLAARREEFTCRPAQDVPELQSDRIVPILGGRLPTRWGDPGDVLDSGL